MMSKAGLRVGVTHKEVQQTSARRCLRFAWLSDVQRCTSWKHKARL